MNEIAFSRDTAHPWETVLPKLEAALKRRGFGVLATMRVHEVLKEKIGAAVEPLVILDVCSPRHAARALEISREAGLMLPCKIVVSLEHGKTRLALLRPTAAIDALMPLPKLRELATEVEPPMREAIEEVVGAPA